MNAKKESISMEEHLKYSYAGSSVEYDERESLIRSIEKTFFDGCMGYNFYLLIEKLIEDDGMSAEQVYMAFSNCYEKFPRTTPFKYCLDGSLQSSIKKQNDI